MVSNVLVGTFTFYIVSQSLYTENNTPKTLRRLFDYLYATCAGDLMSKIYSTEAYYNLFQYLLSSSNCTWGVATNAIAMLEESTVRGFQEVLNDLQRYIHHNHGWNWNFLAAATRSQIKHDIIHGLIMNRTNNIVTITYKDMNYSFDRCFLEGIHTDTTRSVLIQCSVYLKSYAFRPREYCHLRVILQHLGVLQDHNTYTLTGSVPGHNRNIYSSPLPTISLQPFAARLRESLRVSLYPHQEDTLRFLVERETQPISLYRPTRTGRLLYSSYLNCVCLEEDHEPIYGGLLGSEMGLGKTLSILSLCVCYPQTTTLIIAPVTVLGQWESEIRTNTRGLTCVIFHGPKRASMLQTTPHVVITSYGVLVSEFRKLTSPLLEPNRFGRVVLDESHEISAGASTKKFQACHSLVTRSRYCITGTPFRTNIVELAPILAFLRLIRVSDIAYFRTCREQYMRDILRDSRLTLRYGLEAIANELPICKTVYHLIPLDDYFQRRYHSIWRETSEIRHTKRVEYLPFIMLQWFLQRLRQFASHGIIVTVKSPDSYVVPSRPNDSLPELHAIPTTEDTCVDDSCCPICLDVLEAPCVLPCTHIYCHECLSSLYQNRIQRRIPQLKCPLCRQVCVLSEIKKFAIPPPLPQSLPLPAEDHVFPKLVYTVDLLQRVLRGKTNKVVIFSQYKYSLSALMHRLRAADISFLHINGSMTQSKRCDTLEKFQHDHNSRVFLISFKTGAVGLNLTSANHIILYDVCVNGSLHKQALGRVHRLGQKRAVTVHNLMCQDTVEQKMVEIRRMNPGVSFLNRANILQALRDM